MSYEKTGPNSWKASNPYEAYQRNVEVYQQMQADPQRYLAEVHRALERVVDLRERHAPQIEAGHQGVTPGTRCNACVGILQVVAALRSEGITDHERVHARLDEIEGAIEAMQGV